MMLNVQSESLLVILSSHRRRDYNKQIKDLATVITNLMSAIPWVGQDIVESKNITEYSTMVASALILPTIGTVHAHALKKGNKSIRLNKKEYLSIPASFIAFLVGFIDGDGYIQVTRTTKGFITIKLVISIHLDDISTLQYIHSVLKLGKISVYTDIKAPRCKLIINRTDLQEVFFPLLLHHEIFFLTDTRRAQFDLAMFILKEDKKVYDELPTISAAKHEQVLNIPSLFLLRMGGQSALPKNAEGYANLRFFKSWIVGFTCAEGSFLLKSNNDACFQLKQKIHLLLFEAFKLVFQRNRKIDTEKGLYNQFSVSSKADIQTVINFFSFSGFHPLIGLKGIQYLIWLNLLRNSYRYSNLNFPL